jgi:proline racemase
MRWSRTFTVVDCHAEGEIGKVVTGGIFDVPGHTMFDKMRYLEQHRDGLRKFLLFEPRRTVNHNANIILPLIPTVAGQAWITAISQVGYDPTDPFPEGFTLSDI